MQIFRLTNFINPNTFHDIFRGLKYKNYRYYFMGQGVSMLGTWVQNIAMGWLVYTLSGSALLLGTVVFALQVPSLLITPFAGVLVDRLDRRKVLIVSQILPMVTSFILTALVLTGNITVGLILTIAVVNGVILAFDTPFRQAFVPDIVTRPEDLGNAIALNSSQYNLARFIGPPVGGFLIVLIGEGWCFFINGLSFGASLVALVAIKTSTIGKKASTASILAQMVEGIKYSWNFKPIRYLLRLVVLGGFFGLPFQALLPLFAADILQGDARMLGFLTGSLGAGALSGALYLASRKNILRIPTLAFRTSLLFGVGLAVFAISPYQILSMFALLFVGFGMIVFFNATNTLIQSLADEDKRGRVVSLYTLSFLGVTPIGSLAAGAIAEFIGVPLTVLSFSAICIISALLFGKRVKLVMRNLIRKLSE
jgi:MFS family permease